MEEIELRCRWLLVVERQQHSKEAQEAEEER